MPTFPQDVDLFIKQAEQDCSTGAYMESGWMECMKGKVQMLIDAIEAHPGEALLHVDADIQFFIPHLKPLLLRQLERFDFVAQPDGRFDHGDVFCGGFFAFRATPEIHALFTRVMEVMEKEGLNDQEALNQVLPTTSLKAELLHPDLFWSPRNHWQPGMPLLMSPCAIMHHANWCVGVEAKEEQLRIGREIYQRRLGLERHGGDYGGKWIQENSLSPESVVYSFGIGEDISFDLSLIDRYGVQVHAFDPTPRAMNYGREFAAVEPNFHMYPYALGDQSGQTVKFHLPEDEEYVSCSVVERDTNAFEVPSKSLQEVLSELGHDRIDLLKMDIEGAEYDVLEAMLLEESEILPGQILVEFHDSFDSSFPKRKEVIIQKLLNKGYGLSHQEGAEYSFARGE